MFILAIIPARSKSKGVKNKNIKKINNKELLYFTIKRAKQSKLITNIIGSTDSKIYEKVFKKYSIWTPKLRPKKLSGDKSNIINTLIYKLKIAEKFKKKTYDYVVLLQPTSPFRKKNEIDVAIKKLIKSKCDSLISLCELQGVHPIKMKRIDKKLVKNFIPKSPENPPRQSLQKLYVPSGNLYIVKRNILLKNRSLIGKKQTFAIINKDRYINIDNNKDFEYAKIKLRNFK